MTHRKLRVVFIVEAGQTGLSTRKMLVETAGYNCISAVTCEQALELAERVPIDLILFDVDVHDLPIRETVAKLKQSFPKAPVFLLTPLAWPPEELKGVGDGVFEKMSDPLEMIAEVERRLG